MALELDDAFWMEVTVFAAVAAAPVHRNFNKFIDFDDLKQSACEFAVKKKSKVIEYLDREDKQERRQGEAAPTRCRRHCDRVARKEKAARLGYQPEDEYFYRPAMVENLIKVWGSMMDLVGQVFDPAEMGQKRKIKVASEGNDLLAMMADIDGSHEVFSDSRTYGVLYLRLVDEMKLVEIAKEWEISPQRVDQIVQRGIRKIIEFLGGHTLTKVMGSHVRWLPPSIPTAQAMKAVSWA